jgi:hypothetical protein
MDKELIVCQPLAVVIQDIAERVNGGIIPGAITIADTTVYLNGIPSEKTRRHEAKHREQWKRFRPWWMPLNPWRDRIAYARFLKAYTAEHKAHGYEFNKFEIEAYAAE